MDVFFRTKEESNLAGEAEFLRLPDGDRLYAFLRLMKTSGFLPTKIENNHHENNLEILFDRTMDNWNEEILNFVRLASQHGVRMILVRRALSS